MNRKNILPILFLLVFAAVGMYLVLGSRASSPMPSAGLSSMYLGSAQANALGDTSRYKYVILQDYMYAKVPAIKAANPNTKVLAYKDVAATSIDCSVDAHPPQGVSYCDAKTNHPDWFLLSSSGQPMSFCDFSYLYWMDIGNTAYQQKWIDNVTASVKSDGFDGVFMDDTNFHPGHCMDGNKLQKYTDVQYGQAMVTFANKIANTMHVNGLLAVANMGTDPWTSSQENLALQVAPNLNGFFREHFMHWQSTTPGRFTGATWNALVNEMETVENSTAYIANTYPESATDTQTMRYGRASFLLAWNGRTDSAFQVRPDGNGDPYNIEWGVDIGVPTAARHQVGVAWRRDFTGGTVIVNPDPSQSTTVALGASYLNALGQTVSSVSVGPADAAVLKSITPSALPGDFNNDTHVNALDLSIFLSNYGQIWQPGDLNNSSGVTDKADLTVFFQQYGK